jgi:hypothetical protein
VGNGTSRVKEESGANGLGQRNHLDMSLVETLFDQTDLAEMVGGGVIVGELFFAVMGGVFSGI